MVYDVILETPEQLASPTPAERFEGPPGSAPLKGAAGPPPWAPQADLGDLSRVAHADGETDTQTPACKRKKANTRHKHTSTQAHKHTSTQAHKRTHANTPNRRKDRVARNRRGKSPIAAPELDLHNLIAPTSVGAPVFLRSSATLRRLSFLCVSPMFGTSWVRVDLFVIHDQSPVRCP